MMHSRSFQPYAPARTTAPPAVRWLTLIAWAMLWPVRVVAARRHLALLASLTDRELADIGVGRHDLRNAASLRLDDDPTAYLAAVAAERACARRAQAQAWAQRGHRST